VKKLVTLFSYYRGYSVLGMAGFLLLGLVNSPALGVEQVGLYDVFETRVANSKTYSNPFDFNVIELRAIFTSPSGSKINFFGFYDGDGNGGQTGNVWKLRFMPNEIGTWTYTYTWTDGTPGGSGSFAVVDTGLPGPLKIATDNPWYFMTARGDPFHARPYDMHGNGSLTPPPYSWTDQYNDYIDDRVKDIDTYVVSRGYNMVMNNGPGWLMFPGHNWWYFNGTTTNLDRFHIRTWISWEREINHYRANRIYVFPFGLIAQWDVNTVGNSRIARFYRYFVARNAPYWNLFGYGLTWEWWEGWTESTVTSWMNNPKNWNPFGTLLTIHDSMPSSFDSWGGFTMRQYQESTNDVFNSRSGGQGGGAQGPFLNKPIIGAEDLWECVEGPCGAQGIRRGAWGEMMAGVIPLYSEWGGDGIDPRGNGAGEPEVLRMFDFFYSKTRYRHYQPLNSLVSSAARQVASGIPGEEYLVYDEDGGSISINLSGAPSTKSFSVLWYDPKTGAQQSGGSVSGGATRTLTSPFSGDTVLLLGGQPQDNLPPAPPTALRVAQ
jgi:hypothetical protein